MVWSKGAEINEFALEIIVKIMLNAKLNSTCAAEKMQQENANSYFLRRRGSASSYRKVRSKDFATFAVAQNTIKSKKILISHFLSQKVCFL